MIHREHIERYTGTLAEMADDIGNLRYDALAVLLRALAAKLDLDAVADAGRDRPKLAAALREGAAGVTTAAVRIEQAWSISARHM
jgi:hypothetical protein